MYVVFFRKQTLRWNRSAKVSLGSNTCEKRWAGGEISPWYRPEELWSEGGSLRSWQLDKKWLGLYTTSCLAVDWGHSKNMAVASTALLRHWLGPAQKRARPQLWMWGSPWGSSQLVAASQPHSLQLSNKSFPEGSEKSEGHISVFATVVYCYQITLQSINTCSCCFGYLLLCNKQNGLQLQI